MLEEGFNLFVYAVDFSKRAIEFVENNPLYDSSKVKGIVHDISKEDLHKELTNPADLISMIFVLSAIHPDKMQLVLKRLFQCLKPNGMVLFRDYAINDMAMIRFKPGSKLGDRFYVRQDGTRLVFGLACLYIYFEF